MESLEDFFHFGAGGDAHPFQVVAGEGCLDITELIEEELDMLASDRGITG